MKKAKGRKLNNEQVERISTDLADLLFEFWQKRNWQLEDKFLTNNHEADSSIENLEKRLRDSSSKK